MKTKILPLLMISFVALSIIGVVALERVNSNPELKDAINEVAGKNRIIVKKFIRFRVGEGL